MLKSFTFLLDKKRNKKIKCFYYEILQAKKEEGKHSLKIATIFSYAANEDDKDANGLIPEELDVRAKPLKSMV